MVTTEQYKELTAQLCSSKKKNTHARDTFEKGCYAMGGRDIVRVSTSKKVGKAVYKFGIVTLPLPTLSPVWIVLGKLLSMYDMKDIRKVSITTMREGKKQIRLIKVKMRVY